MKRKRESCCSTRLRTERPNSIELLIKCGKKRTKHALNLKSFVTKSIT